MGFGTITIDITRNGFIVRDGAKDVSTSEIFVFNLLGHPTYEGNDANAPYLLGWLEQQLRPVMKDFQK